MASTSSSSSSDVILVLCGWAGSQEKHLSIYEELLRRVLSRTVPGVRVASAIRCSLPLRLIFSPVESPRTSWVVENVMEPLRSCAEDLQSSSPTVLVHAFSNGGGFVVEQMVKLYEREELRANPDRIRLPPIGGIIFDSAPGYDGGEMGERVLAEVLGTGAWYQRAGIRVAHASQRLAARLINSNRQKDYWKLMTDIGGGYLVFGIVGSLSALTALDALDALTALTARMHRSIGRCPTLHLYSMDDPLCDPDRLYELIMAKLDRGMDVQHRCWDVSGHCAHYKLHKGEYEEAVSAFLARVYGGRPPPAARRRRAQRPYVFSSRL